MMKFSSVKSIFLCLSLFAAFSMMAEQESKEVVFEKVYEKPLEVSRYVWSIDVDRAFANAVKKLKEQNLSVEMEVSSTGENVLAGAKVKVFSKEKSGTCLVPLFWKGKATEEKKVYTGKYTATVKKPGRVLFLIYNCNAKDVLLVHRFKLTVSGTPFTEEELAKDKKTIKTIDPNGSVPLTPLSVKRDFFPAGAYFYLSQEGLGATPEEAEQKFRDCMKDIAAHSCNAVYLSGISGNIPLLNRYCDIAAEHGVKVFAQGNGALYLQLGMGPEYFENVTLPALRKHLPQIKTENLIGFSTKEEIDPDDYAIEHLRRARSEQKKIAENIPVYTLHNRLVSMAMDDDPSNQPDWYAFDMYRFKLHPDRNVIMTPSKAAIRIRTNLEIAYLHAAKFGKPLIFVGQGVKCYSTIKSDKYTKASGLQEVSPGVWQGYTRYMPKNAMYLQFYLAVMSGCRGFMVYHYMSSPSEQALVKQDLTPQFYWTEMGECLAEVKKLFPLFASWYKQPRSTELQTSSKTIPVREFKHPDFPGRFLLPVNTLIAKWDKNNPILTKASTQLYSDEENLQGFEWAEPQTFALMTGQQEPVYDLLTGQQTDLEKITLMPGKGQVFFQGSAEELAGIREKMQLK